MGPKTNVSNIEERNVAIFGQIAHNYRLKGTHDIYKFHIHTIIFTQNSVERIPVRFGP